MSQVSFQYQAIDAQGAKTKGMLNAANQEDAYRKLLALGLKPLRIANRRGRVRGRGRKVTLKDISQLTFQFSVLTESRIPLVDGLRSIVEQEQNTRLRTVVEDVANQIEGGVTVTEALGPHRAIFGEVYVESVRAAEASGNMVEVLARLAEMLDRQPQMAKDVKGALMYPACVGVQLQTVDFDTNVEVGVDWLGRPLNQTEAALTLPGSVVLTGNHTVSVTPETGHVYYTPP